jgi:hypothetical protein
VLTCARKVAKRLLVADTPAEVWAMRFMILVKATKNTEAT